MNIITSNVQVQLTQEEKNKLQDAREVISHLYNTMKDHKQMFIQSNDSDVDYCQAQVWDTYSLLSCLISSDKIQLEN